MAQKKSTPIKSLARAKRASQTEADSSVSKVDLPARATKSSRQSPPKPAAKEKRAQGQEARKEDFPVVGIGASAGGLEAFRQLLEHLAVDTGMAFVLVQHLDPTHKSILTELLARSTKIPVSEVSDGMRVEPNHIYVIPPNTSMGITDGVLRLRPREEGRAGRHPVDYFLRTLSEDQSHSAIGVILSGTDADGTLGLEAIKAEGGITFAQEPTSAKYDGMPRNAIASGHVDFILTPEGIAEELARISRHPYVSPPASATPIEEEQQPAGRNGFRKILALLHKAKGVDFTDYKANTLHRRIARRMVLNKLESMDDYTKFLRENAAEVEALYQDILISVTSFFRNPEAFAVLKERIFPQVVEQRTPNEPIRVWTLGCSTGEEAYSIAMSFAEFAGDQAEHVPIQIFATDLSDRGIEKARAGLYSKDITEDVSPERLRRFFVEADGGYRVSKPIRDMVVFARQNVIADPPFSRLDLISCRNLLIYLEPVLQQRVLPLLHYALKPTGVLWLGTSETPGQSSDLFAPEDKKHRFYSKKPASARLHFHPASGSAAGQSAGSGQKTNLLSEQLRGEHDAQKEADRILLARYAPAGVVINAELEILQFRGSTGAYLEPPSGKATLNLLKMAREGLMLPLRVAIQKAKKDDKTIRKEGVLVKYDGEFRQLNLEVIPIKGLAAHERSYLVLFEPVAPTAAPEGGETAGSKRKAKGRKQEADDHQAARLQEELSVTREYMQSLVEQQEAANEELQSANEEIQSSNEELQSINEELETSKEELESSNEELATLNDELHNRNQELTTFNNDQSNLFASINIPILFLGPDLRIRRFTPPAEKLLSLISTDVGRPVGDIKLKINVPDLEELIVEVIDTVSAKEREVRDTQGRWYLMRVRPYKTLDNRIDGAVVVLVDIDALKQSAAAISEARDYIEAIVETMREPLIVLDENLRVQTANRSFYEDFHVTPEETENQLLYELGNRQWDIPRLRTLLEEILPKNIQFQDFEVEHVFESIGPKTMLLNARRLEHDGSSAQLILLAIEDITERKQGVAALRGSEERFRTLVEQVKDYAIFSTDKDGRATTWNEGVKQVLGFDEAEFIGLDIAPAIFTPEDVWAGVPERELQTAAAEGSAGNDRWMRRKDGTRFYASGITTALKDESGAVIGFSKVLRDTTEHLLAEEERKRLLAREQQARAAADEANRLKDEFLATVSHEIRTPLTAIMGWTDMLQGGRLEEQTAARAIEAIARNARAQNQIIADLLDVSRIVSGKLRFEVGAVDLSEVIEAALETVRPAAEAKGVELRVKLDEAAGLVPGDADRLQQMVWNLLANAVKYTPRGGQVEVRLEREDTHVTVVVRDTGEGISPEILPYIFDRFRQADGTTTRKHGGLGLGLAIVRHLTEAHGGTVRAASRGADQGATFTVTLPLIAARQEKSEAGRADAGETLSDRAPASQSLHGLRVLVVDDEPDARELLMLAFTQAGAEVRVVATVRAALETLDQWTPDVLVSDIGMPGEDGYDLIREVRAHEQERGRSIPALALTGYAGADDTKRALTAGFQMHVPKPVELGSLVEAVASLAGRAGKI